MLYILLLELQICASDFSRTLHFRSFCFLFLFTICQHSLSFVQTFCICSRCGSIYRMLLLLNKLNTNFNQQNNAKNHEVYAWKKTVRVMNVFHYWRRCLLQHKILLYLQVFFFSHSSFILCLSYLSVFVNSASKCI